MNRTTVSERLAELRAPEPPKTIGKVDILETLPGHLPAPTVSNIKNHYRTEAAGAWLSFRDGDDPLEVLEALEAVGTVSPLTLARWGSWRRSPWPGAIEAIPEESCGDTLTDAQPILPLWLTLDTINRRPEAHTFINVAGLLYRVTVRVELPAIISVRRVEFRGGWAYQGPALLRFPDGWYAFGGPGEDGEPWGQVAAASGAYMGAGYPVQSADGAIYFEETYDDGAERLPSTILRALEAAGRTGLMSDGSRIERGSP